MRYLSVGGAFRVSGQDSPENTNNRIYIYSSYFQFLSLQVTYWLLAAPPGWSCDGRDTCVSG